MLSRPCLKTEYLGLHSCRFQATAISESSIYYTIGSHIAKRDLQTFSVTQSFQAHTSMISALILTQNSLISVDYYGNIAIHSLSGDLVHYYKIPSTSLVPKGVRTAISNPDHSLLAILSLGGNPYNGTIEIYSLESNGISYLRSLRGNFRQCEFINNEDLFVLRQTVIEGSEYCTDRQRDKPLTAEKATEDFLSETEEIENAHQLLESMTSANRKTVGYWACVFEGIRTRKSARSQVLDIFARVNCIRQNHLGKVAFATVTRVIYVMDMHNLSIIHTICLSGGGNFTMLIFEGDSLYFSPQVKILCKFDTSQPGVSKNFDINTDSPELICVKTEETWIHKNNFLAWAVHEKILISLNEYGIYKATFTAFPSPEITDKTHECIFKITCCGLKIHSELPLVAIGDFSGGIFIFDYLTNSLVNQSQITGSIRSLSWYSDTLFIGTLDGAIYLWAYLISDPLPYFDLNTSILCQAWHLDTLSIGCTSGDIYIFNNTPSVTHKFLAHEPQESDEKFGSLELYSEIWSICWSPCGNFIATGSEDQSVRVWDAVEYKLIRKLEKFKRAVTGVRWEKVKEFREGVDEILVCCSDDETMRIYDVKNWDVLHVFDTSVLQEWHTITYAAIEKEGTRVACVTQNGFLFIMELKDMSFTAVERVHNGSVEGLDWKDRLITCSSEGLACVVSV